MKKDPSIAEKRKYLYQLENMGIATLEKKVRSNGWCDFSWKLTSKGKALAESDKELDKLWKEDKIKEFYEKINDD